MLSGKCHLGLRGSILLLLLTACYLMICLHYPKALRFAIVGTILGGIFIVMKPRPAFWLPFLPLVFLLGGGTISVGVFNPSVLTLAVFGFFCFYIVDKVAWNEPLPRFSFAVKLVFIALVLQIISVAISVQIHGQYLPNAVREGSSVFLFMPLIFMVPDLCRTEENLLRLLRGLVLTLLLAGAAGIVEYMSIPGFSRVDISIGHLYKGRVSSFLGNANVFAGYLELAIPVAVALGLWEKSIKWRVTALIAALLGILSVLFTFSRGGLFSMAVGVGAVLIYQFRKRLWIPVLISILFVGFLVKNADVFERQMSFFMNPGELINQPTLLHRHVTYRGLWNQFLDSPVTGVGWGAEEFFWGNTRIYSFWEIRHSVSTESISHFGGLNSLFLTHAVRGGLISLSSLCLIILAVISASLKAIRKAPFPWGIGLSAGLLGFGIHQIMDNFLCWPQTSSFFWLYIGILLASISVFSRTGNTA